MSEHRGSSSAYTSPTTSHQGGDRSIGELFASLTQDVTTLMRQEVALAKAEVRQSAASAGTGVGLLVGAGLAGFFVLLFLSNAVWGALTNVMDSSWAALIVAVVWAIIAGVLGLVGRGKLKQVEGVPHTTETVKQIPNALKGHEEENR